MIGLLIVAPAAFPTLTIWANNDIIPKAYRLVIVGGFFTLVGVAVFLFVWHILSDTRLAAFITFFVVLTLTSGGQILSRSSWAWRWITALVVLSLAILIVLRLRKWWVLDVIVIAAAAALLLPPLLTGVWNRIAPGEVTPPSPAAVELPPMVDHPDIFLVVLDGYTSLPVLRELFGFEDPRLVGDLAKNDFDLIEPVFSGYPITQLSLPGLLQLDYLAGDLVASTTGERQWLAGLIGGESRLVEMLAKSGYRTTMIEPGWHMSTCGEVIDNCVSDPFIDEAVGTALSQSLLWSFLESSVGSAFTHGSRNAMTGAVEHIGSLLENGTPDFMFVHVLAPHPPLLLDSSCQVDYRPTMDGIDMGMAAVSPETGQARLESYVNQVECVNGFVRQLAARLAGSDSMVFITGDHGSDVLGQLSVEPELWTDPQILERMSVFTAMKVPTDCEFQASLVTVALFRSLISCAGGLDLDPIDDTAFLVPSREIDGRWPEPRMLSHEELADLASCLPEVDENLACETG